VTALRARDLAAADLSEKAAEWERRLRTATEGRVELAHLYQGDQWRRAQALAAAATHAGFAPSLYVASAGLGLRSVFSLAPSYAATFMPRHADSVASSTSQAADWWDHLQRMDESRNLSQIAASAGRILVVLSETYAHAMHRDLLALAASGADTVLIGGALRNALGGTLTSLNARMAAAWLQRCTPGRLITPAAKERWTTWVDQAACPERYARTPMSDAAVTKFIKTMKSRYPDASRTRLLRLLRDEGMACEQKRFAGLYSSTIGQR
jgi:hypothetical protein